MPANPKCITLLDKVAHTIPITMIMCRIRNTKYYMLHWDQTRMTLTLLDKLMYPRPRTQPCPGLTVQPHRRTSTLPMRRPVTQPSIQPRSIPSLQQRPGPTHVPNAVLCRSHGVTLHRIRTWARACHIAAEQTLFSRATALCRSVSWAHLCDMARPLRIQAMGNWVAHWKFELLKKGRYPKER